MGLENQPIKTCSGAVIPTSGKIVVNGKSFRYDTSAAENGMQLHQELIMLGSNSRKLVLGNPIRKGC